MEFMISVNCDRFLWWNFHPFICRSNFLNPKNFLVSTDSILYIRILFSFHINFKQQNLLKILFFFCENHHLNLQIVLSFTELLKNIKILRSTIFFYQHKIYMMYENFIILSKLFNIIIFQIQINCIIFKQSSF